MKSNNLRIELGNIDPVTCNFGATMNAKHFQWRTEFCQQKGEVMNIEVGQKLYSRSLNEIVTVTDKFYVRHLNNSQQETILQITSDLLSFFVDEKRLRNGFSLIIDKEEPKPTVEDLPWDKFEELLPGARWIAKDKDGKICIYTPKPEIRNSESVMWGGALPRGGKYRYLLPQYFPQVYAFFTDIPWKESLIENPNHKEHRVLEYEIVKVICDYGNKVDVQIRITKQSHRNDDFTDNGFEFNYKDLISLKSCDYPENNCNYGLYVRGSESKHDNETITMTLKRYNLFAQAVEAYNKLYN